MIAPAFNELEVSVFGPGFGEAIAVHVGFGDWILVDSCVDPSSGEPQSLRYLRNIGVDVSSQVKAVIASHWHDDHVRGLSKVVQACEAALFCCAAVLTEEEFRAYAKANSDPGTSRLARSTAEIRTILDILQLRQSEPKFLMLDRPLYSRRAGAPVDVISLSPSDFMMQRFLSEIARSMPKPGDIPTKSKKVNPNDLSAVILVTVGGVNMLLGGDLEEGREAAWSSIIKNSVTDFGKSCLFKIPHHGSVTGHCDDVWTKMLIDNPVTAITPWRKGGKSLPTSEDVTRILALAANSFITANPTSVAPYKRLPEVEKQLRESKIKLSLSQPRPGMLRFRRKFTDSMWGVETHGNARRLQHAQII